MITPFLSPAALACLRAHAFPGNVRELRNILERAVLLADGDTISPEHLPAECHCQQAVAAPREPLPQEVVSLAQMGRRYLRWVQARFGGEKRAMAAALGVSERTRYRKLQGLWDAPGEGD